MHLCFAVYNYLAHFQKAEDLLDDFYTLTGWTEALQAAGCRVTVFQRFHQKEQLTKQGVNYHFCPDRFSPSLRPWQAPKSLHQQIAAVHPDLVHAHNLNQVFPARNLRQTLGPHTPILLQNHGETPRYWLRKQLQKHVFQQINAFLFTAKGQEKSWLEQGIIDKTDKVHFVMEGSTHFQWQDRARARQHTNMHGEPVFLWVGNLNPNKDPFTILKAFERILSQYPKARLYMIYRLDDLLTDVRALLQSSPLLQAHVQLLGPKKHQELAIYYNSADYFLLGSHYEGSGYSLMESMACGVVPIVTDIPSFRMMTMEGALGQLWPPEDVDALEAAILKTLQIPLAEQSQKVRVYFEEALSYQAIVKKMMVIYKSLIAG